MTIPTKGRTVESTFVTLFSAIETLLLAYRKAHDLERVLPAKEWRRLHRQLRDCINTSDIPRDQPGKAELLLGKLGDLN
jgi:hypothetical protein